MEEDIRVGLIGYGVAGQVFHAPVIHSVEGLTLHRVTARKPEQRELLRSRYPEARAEGHWQDIIGADDIDLVVIATSNDVHAMLAEEALKAGKHVVVDKPFTNTSADADRLLRIAREQGRLLSVHHNARWNSDFLTVKKLLEKGDLGRLVNFEVRYDRFRNFLRDNWREDDAPGSGIWYDLGSHLIDQALVLFGHPVAVTGDLRKQRDGSRTVDDFMVVLHYPDERFRVTLRGALLVKEPSPRYSIYGEQGAFVKYGIDPQEAALREGKTPDLSGWGEEPEDIWGKLHLDRDGESVIQTLKSEPGNYPAFYQNVYDAIVGKAPLIVKAEEARNVIRIVELGIQSWEEKRTVPASGLLAV